jgi:hypothetical protein
MLGGIKGLMATKELEQVVADMGMRDVVTKESAAEA